MGEVADPLASSQSTGVYRSILNRQLDGGSIAFNVSASTDMLQRLQLSSVLKGHHGCVNTVSFAPDGQLLISGSDDLSICFWDWNAGQRVARYSSGHRANVFQARMMPASNPGTLVTCAADGQVRVGEVLPGGGYTSQRWHTHQGRAHKLALDLQAPAHCFYSCGEDGEVLHYDLRAGPAAGRQRLLLCHGCNARGSVNARVVELNAIHVNPTRPWQFAVGGSDQWARVYDYRRPTRGSSAAAPAGRGAGGSHTGGVASSGGDSGPSGWSLADEPVARLCPQAVRQALASRRGGAGHKHITCVVWSQQGELLATYNDDDCYLFDPTRSSRQRPCAMAPMCSSQQHGGHDSVAGPSSSSAVPTAPADTVAAAAAAPAAPVHRSTAGGNSSSRQPSACGSSLDQPPGSMGPPPPPAGRAGRGAPAVAQQARDRQQNSVQQQQQEDQQPTQQHPRRRGIRAQRSAESEEQMRPSRRPRPPDSTGAPAEAAPAPAAAAAAAGGEPAVLHHPSTHAAAGIPGHNMSEDRQMDADHQEDSVCAVRPSSTASGCDASDTSDEVMAEAWSPAGAPSAPQVQQQNQEQQQQIQEQQEQQQQHGGADGVPPHAVMSGRMQEYTSRHGAEAAAAAAGTGNDDTGSGGWGGRPRQRCAASVSQQLEQQDGTTQSARRHGAICHSDSEPSCHSHSDSGSDSEEDVAPPRRLQPHPAQQQQQQQRRQEQQPQHGEVGPSSTCAGQASASGGGAFPQWADEAWDHMLQCYSGHRNAATVKGVSFFGAADEYVVSGSDCGHIYIWSKGSGQLRWWGKGDEEVVNCLEPHPGLPLTLATSGIEHTIKVWEPTAAAAQPLPREAAAVMEDNRAARGRGADPLVMDMDVFARLLSRVRRMRAEGGMPGIRLPRQQQQQQGQAESPQMPAQLQRRQAAGQAGLDAGEQHSSRGGQERVVRVVVPTQLQLSVRARRAATAAASAAAGAVAGESGGADSGEEWGGDIHDDVEDEETCVVS